MEKRSDKLYSFIDYSLGSLACFILITVIISIFLPLFRLRLRLWIWKILVAMIVIGLCALMIKLVFSIRPIIFRFLAFAALVVLFSFSGELLMLGGMLFFTQTEEVITRDGEKYVMEVERFDDTFVRFYPYKNLFFSGPIKIEESYPSESITYYDKYGSEISHHLVGPESYDELWYLSNKMKY